MLFPKHFQQLGVADLLRIEFDKYRFGMPGSPTANTFVSGIRRDSAGVTNGSCNDSGSSAELRLDSPESPSGERSQLMTSRMGGGEDVSRRADVTRSHTNT
jgi:hypothetical protein